ncbi:ABC transporter permease [Facklamia sp. 7083-14-GEN3]|uniref:ABC transporter permease n=1 Tax=Facklamia sp. 7083-14-GEN3 TaxID=2973478 RepID=UPI00215CFEFA|nr:ABC transporter permease [Facklamia sp. 7083-14-GEN3]MCR8970008.1 ABC transporter permease [Facklamia sp. 7083-14-GEN3]
MNNLNQLFNKRANQLLKEIGKYGRLIFNDHFSIVIFVLMGFLALTYRDLLERLNQASYFSFVWMIPLMIAFFLTVFLNLGHPLWLNHEADRSYLFPRGRDWFKYWRKAFIYTALSQAGLALLIGFLFYPLISIVSDWNQNNAVFFCFIYATLKVLAVINQYLNLYYQNSHFLSRNSVKTLNYFTGVFITISFYLPDPYPLIIMLVVSGLYLTIVYWRYRLLAKNLIDFEFVIKQSQANKSRFYKLISLFADVPQVKTPIKERKWLYPLMNLIQGKKVNRYSYFFARMITRHEGYSGIWLRITVFILIIILLLPENWLALTIIGVIGFWLALIQILPIYLLGNNLPFQLLYPTQDLQLKKAAFQKMLASILAMMMLAFCLGMLVKVGLSLTLLWVSCAWLIIILAIIYLYVPIWLKKLKKEV